MTDVAKLAAAQAAVGLIEGGMTVGLGTGSTVDLMLAPLAARGLDLRCVATSVRTEKAAQAAGIRVELFASFGRLDIAVDGADQVAPSGWLVKGGGAAHTREKMVAAAADRFVVIVDDSKLVERIAPPIPVELLAFGLASILRALGSAQLRDVPPSPDDGVIADYLGVVDDPATTAAWLSGVPGVVEHGLFPPSMVHEILVGRDDGSVERRTTTA